MWCPHHFPQNGRNSTLSSEDFPQEVPKSGYGSGRGINTSASRLDQRGGGGTGFRDRSTASDGGSSKKHATQQVDSTLLKTNSHIKVSISCEAVSYKKIYKGSYTSGDLKDNEAHIAVKDGTNFIVGSSERFTRVSIGKSSISVGCEKISSFSDANSATTFGSGFGFESSMSCFLQFSPRQLGSSYI